MAMPMVSVQLATSAGAAVVPLRTRRLVSVCAAPPRQRPRPPPSGQGQGRRRPRRNDDDGLPPVKRGQRGRGPPPRNTRQGPPRSPPAPVARYQQEEEEDEFDRDEEEEEEEGRFGGGTRGGAMPKPPAGFVLDEQGRCIAAASKRIVTIIDETNKRPLECIIRRVFRSTQEHECMLLCPVDMPVQVLKSANFSGWDAIDDDQLQEIIPSVAYALARVHMHFVESGFCYTARGGFCFPEDAIQEFHDSGDSNDGVPFEGVEICCFNLDGAHYMIYTPVDPLLFVAVKDKDGMLRIAEDELMDDPGVVDAIDEETEFTALVEEEEALLESVLGER